MIGLIAVAIIAFSPHAATAAQSSHAAPAAAPKRSVSVTPTPVQQKPAGKDAPGWGIAALALVIGLGAGAGGAALASGSRRRPRAPMPGQFLAAPPPLPPASVRAAPAPDPGIGEHAAQLELERSALLQSIIEARDVVPSAALRERLDQTVAEAGVVVIAPSPGDRFDVEQHRAVQARPALTPEQQGTVAETVRPGFHDRRRLIRPAEVEVFQWIPS
jgi:hypothetical protein